MRKTRRRESSPLTSHRPPAALDPVNGLRDPDSHETILPGDEARFLALRRRPERRSAIGVYRSVILALWLVEKPIIAGGFHVAVPAQ
jgi:hypothetical protein